MHQHPPIRIDKRRRDDEQNIRSVLFWILKDFINSASRNAELDPYGDNGTGDKAMLDIMRALALDKKGATAIEYGLIVALIVIAMIGALTGLANTTIGMWTNVANKVSGAS